MTSTLKNLDAGKHVIDEKEWFKLFLETQHNALCVKSHDRENFGRISNLEVVLHQVTSNESLHMFLRAKNEEVVVIGHNDDAGFVWRGTSQEFIETWVVD